MPFTLQDNYETGDTAGLAFRDTDWLGQHITTGSAYTITRIGMKLYRVAGTTGTITAGVRTSPFDGGTDIATGTVAASTLTTDTNGDWVYFDLGAGAALSNNTSYMLWVHWDTHTANQLFWRVNFTTASYSGGEKWSSNNSGTTWTATASQDLMFRTYSGSASSYVEISATGGATSDGSGTLTYATVVAIAATGGSVSSGSGTLEMIISLSGDYTNKYERKKIIVIGSDSVWIED